MRLIALPDLHQNTHGLKALADQLAQVDVVLLVGDLTNMGGAEAAAAMV